MGFSPHNDEICQFNIPPKAFSKQTAKHNVHLYFCLYGTSCAKQLNFEEIFATNLFNFVYSARQKLNYWEEIYTRHTYRILKQKYMYNVTFLVATEKKLCSLGRGHVTQL